MVPALTATSRTAAAPVQRLAMVYVPNGMAMGYWMPKAEGPLDELPPTLESLSDYRDKVLMVSGLADKSAGLSNRGGDHARAAGTYLTCVPYRAISDSNVHAGVSMDQIAARQLGQDLRAAGKSADITVFAGADHAFFNDTRPEVYDAARAATCWSRLLAFYREHVR